MEFNDALTQEDYELHQKALRGEEGGVFLDLRGANLRHANLRDANLRGANLRDAMGNRREVKSMHVDVWHIVYTSTHIFIGCETHTTEEWKEMDDERIDSMDDDALDWWESNKAWLFDTIERFPAVPYKTEGD